MTEQSPKNTFTMYGIKNCDTVKKARKYLEAGGVNYQFHDYRADGLEADLLQRFIDVLGWEALLNTRGTTWRKLEESERKAVDNPAAALTLMLSQPAMIKRPLLCAADGSMLLGFSEATYSPFIQEKSSLCTVRS
ncbi:MAG TPA: ArsC family reductase [Erwinia persicina]|uniref:ArsC family reductase n=1 Tax=Erwinia persicina TaxID=55211 RepID=A0A3S5GSI1_9GAMM|nr:ArsC family reductase [Erwinia persicina]AXU94072.1 ArsC family reductase [Erwinia persicina]MBC3946092.1 ArsC family reductase [Erwinia persicina]MBD8106762.1 ArsC family reductase [Erwinia persicina]MBD8168527.1 ArsC family reductase [Erwinia persicina]MBD8209841.1 ArsC family reductase [Erwinia persicina]